MKKRKEKDKPSKASKKYKKFFKKKIRQSCLQCVAQMNNTKYDNDDEEEKKH
jgi:hypothetical protein